MNEDQIGGGLRLRTAGEKTDAFAEFLKTRMMRARAELRGALA